VKILNLTLTHDAEFSSYLLNSIFRIRIYANTINDGTIEVTNDAEVYSLDQDNFLELIEQPKHTFLAKKEGSGIIKAVYTYNGETFYISKQFVCYTSFFKDNYLTHLFPEYDADNIRSNQISKSTFDTLMDMLDILYAYNSDLQVIANFKNGKSKFLSLMSQNVGFERFDFSQVNTPYELIETESFRELITNMTDLLSLRGTKLAYEIFFNALGYNLKLEEFWYDKDGNLIEINSEDETLSTYYAYNTSGEFIDNPPYPRSDPRLHFGSDNIRNAPSGYLKTYENNKLTYKKQDFINNKQLISNSNNNFINNKSNYIRVYITDSINNNIYQSLNAFSLEKRLAIKKYLEFLRPSRVQYIDEAFGYNLVQETLSSLEDQINFAQLILYSLTNENLEQIFEKFISTTVKNINDELASKNKWDRKLKWDIQLKYDFKTHLIEELAVTGL
jgi:hypothetical protein